MSSSNPITLYGWDALPRDVPTQLKQHAENALTTAPPVFSTNDFPLPKSDVVTAVMEYAKAELSTQTFHHSMRVFYYGMSIATHAFPSWLSETFTETYFLTCLLHDIGTTDKNLQATLLSFEFYGGYLALDLCKKHGAPAPQAESVAEAIIRHQDVGPEGALSRMGALIQFSTKFDNSGNSADLVAKGTIENVVKAYPRLGWSKCFSKTLKKEMELKPWCHTKNMGERAFPDSVRGNKLMEPYDDSGL